jgi:hypothetical protein
MKKKFCTITVIAFLTLLLVSTFTFVNAQGYTRTSWSTQDIPTIDGMWTFETEWTDGEITMIGEDVAFRSTWDMQGSDVITRWIVEIFSDTTDDPGDVWLFCIDGDQIGGSSPQVGIHRAFEITGHTDLVLLMGDSEGGWTERDMEPGEIEWAASLSDSPTNSTAHWILEFQIGKNTGEVLMGILWNFRLSVFDASNPDAGELCWPPDSDADVPDTWGEENYQNANIPESLTFGVVVLLSSVAVLVGSSWLRKRSRIGKSNEGD